VNIDININYKTSKVKDREDLPRDWRWDSWQYTSACYLFGLPSLSATPECDSLKLPIKDHMIIIILSWVYFKLGRLQRLQNILQEKCSDGVAYGIKRPSYFAYSVLIFCDRLNLTSEYIYSLKKLREKKIKTLQTRSLTSSSREMVK